MGKTKTNIEDIQGKIDYSQSAEPILNDETSHTGYESLNYLAKAINWIKTQLGLKADNSQPVAYTKSATELVNNETHLINDIINTYGGNISQLFYDLAALGVKKAYIATQVTGALPPNGFYGGDILFSTHGIAAPKVVEFYENGEKIVCGLTIGTDAKVSWLSTKNFTTAHNFKIIIIG